MLWSLRCCEPGTGQDPQTELDYDSCVATMANDNHGILHGTVMYCPF